MTYEEFNKGCFEEAKRLYKTANADQRYVLENLFPELKESEDEKIRKDVKRAISVALDYSYFDKETANNCLAWLEKQGEQKPIIEMKSAEESLGISSEEYNDIVNECLYGESKAEWKQENVEELSEFENAMMHIGYSFFGKRGGLDPNDTSLVKVQAQYLLELAQKPAEWSEDDDDDAWMNDIISKVENNLQLNKAEIDWLKSLKPQNTWKPSDEQMKALDSVIDEYDGYPEFDSLVSLKNDLRKL